MFGATGSAAPVTRSADVGTAEALATSAASPVPRCADGPSPGRSMRETTAAPGSALGAAQAPVQPKKGVARRRNHRRQTRETLYRRHHALLDATAPGVLHAVDDEAVATHAQAREREGRTREVAAAPASRASSPWELAMGISRRSVLQALTVGAGSLAFGGGGPFGNMGVARAAGGMTPRRFIAFPICGDWRAVRACSTASPRTWLRLSSQRR